MVKRKLNVKTKSQRSQGKSASDNHRKPAKASAAPAKSAPSKSTVVDEPLPVAEQADVAPGEKWSRLIMAGVLVVLFFWAYFPTLAELVEIWDREPDYSHGFLVLPIALVIAWARRGTWPGLSPGLAWFGLVLIGASLSVRYFGAAIYIDAIDGWSILLWVAGAVWLLCGGRALVWALPAVLFLAFLVPLPFAAETYLSLPLQRVATKISVLGLQFLGQPALSEGNVILLGENRLEVAQACSGLRIFMGIVALSFAYLFIARRSWWVSTLLVLAVLPIALVANSTRIIVTGLLYQYVSSDAAHKFTHDLAGWVMIPFAAGLFALVLWFLGKLTYEVDTAAGRDLLRQLQDTREPSGGVG